MHFGQGRQRSPLNFIALQRSRVVAEGACFPLMNKLCINSVFSFAIKGNSIPASQRVAALVNVSMRFDRILFDDLHIEVRIPSSPLEYSERTSSASAFKGIHGRQGLRRETKTNVQRVLSSSHRGSEGGSAQSKGFACAREGSACPSVCRPQVATPQFTREAPPTRWTYKQMKSFEIGRYDEPFLTPHSVPHPSHNHLQPSTSSLPFPSHSPPSFPLSSPSHPSFPLTLSLSLHPSSPLTLSLPFLPLPSPSPSPFLPIHSPPTPSPFPLSLPSPLSLPPHPSFPLTLSSTPLSLPTPPLLTLPPPLSSPIPLLSPPLTPLFLPPTPLSLLPHFPHSTLSPLPLPAYSLLPSTFLPTFPFLPHSPTPLSLPHSPLPPPSPSFSLTLSSTPLSLPTSPPLPPPLPSPFPLSLPPHPPSHSLSSPLPSSSPTPLSPSPSQAS
ncbi:hypothetical protein C7M84_011838 [Penaeus vannamei]|uniref:Uncharacterized protein n=1 Tax=Penaeus vannamei TaxID=6689 RepID=A0A423T0A6_PENVA|nr:hypothetical protein C7M84_011838 [Penaeus vannamei]